jgi:hypothetical protein
MRAKPRRAASLLVLSLLLALIGLLLPSQALAQVPSINIVGAGVGRCGPNERPVASGPQGTNFQVNLRNFAAFGGVLISVTLPDGRIFDANPGAALPLPIPPATFPAPVFVPDLLLAPIPIAHTAVNAAHPIPTHTGWPTGCYTVTVTTPTPPGAPPAPHATARFLLQPESLPLQPGNLQLFVHALGTNQPTAAQPLFPAAVPLNIFGRGPVGATINLVMINPNGSRNVIALGGPVAVAPGGFWQFPPVPLPANSPPGTYTLVASTPAPNPASIQAQFTLTPPVSALTTIPPAAAGNPVLLINPTSKMVPQVPAAPVPVTIAGQSFPPGVPLTAVLVLPDGGRIGGGPFPVDGSGNLLPFAFDLNRSFPTGTYRVEVLDVATPTVLATTSFRLTNP